MVNKKEQISSLRSKYSLRTRQCTNVMDPVQGFQILITPENIEENVRWVNLEITNRQSNLLRTTKETKIP